MKIMKLVTLFVFSVFFISTLCAKESASKQLTNLVNSAFIEANKNNHYISLAARNKMLSQQIAKDAAKIVTKIREKEARNDILIHANEFDRTIQAFINGDKKLGVEALSNPLAKEQLQEIVSLWQPFYGAVKKLAKSKKTDVLSFVFIHRNNERLLALSHKLTQTLKSQRKFKTTFSPIIEHTLKFLDRERFLTQKMLKEKLLIFRKIDVKRNNVRLSGSFILFEHTLDGLLHGDKKRGFIAITNKAIRAKVLQLDKEWKKVSNIYKFKKRGLSKKDILKLDSNNELMLQITEELVHMVENSLGI